MQCQLNNALHHTLPSQKANTLQRNPNQSGLITLQFVQGKEQVPGAENPVLRQEFPLPQDTTVGTVSWCVPCNLFLVWISKYRVKGNISSTWEGKWSQGNLQNKDLLWVIKHHQCKGTGCYGGQADEAQLVSKSKSCLAICLDLRQNYSTFSHASTAKWAG